MREEGLEPSPLSGSDLKSDASTIPPFTQSYLFISVLFKMFKFQFFLNVY